MSLRTKFNLDFSVSEDSTGGQELGKSDPWFGTNDQMDNGGTFRRKVAAGQSNVQIDVMGLLNVRFLTIKSDQTITVKKNSTSGEPWSIRSLGVGATDAIWITTTDGITSLYLSNPGSVDAEVTLTIAGTN